VGGHDCDEGDELRSFDTPDVSSVTDVEISLTVVMLGWFLINVGHYPHRLQRLYVYKVEVGNDMQQNIVRQAV